VTTVGVTQPDQPETGAKTGLVPDESALMRQVRIFRSRGVARNGLFSIMQAVVSIICLFLSYRIVIAEAGLASLGLWSLLITFGGVAVIADVSGASALARSVARHDQDHPDASLAEVIHTVIITSLAINTVLVALLLLVAPTVIARWVEPHQQILARSLVPWVAGTMILTPLSVGIAASIDGLQRADQRAVLLASAALAGLFIAWFAVPQMCVAGIAVAQLLQQALIVIAGWLLLRSKVPGLGWLPLRWRKNIFKQTTSYALKLNAIGFFGLFFEPLTKFCINSVGGTLAVGIYELAARLIMQVRTLVVSASSPLLPAFAAYKDTDQAQLSVMLGKSQAFVLLAALAVMLVSLLGAPIMSFVILDEISAEVLRTNALLTVGWCVNLFALPLYIAAQGIGVLRWNMVSHVILAMCVGLAAILPAMNSSVTGILLGVVVGLVLGALAAMIGNATALGQTRALRAIWPRLSLCAGLIGAGCFLAWVVAPLWTLP
jgi:O-antigen/teichoic acid export membrane protein